MLWNDKHFLKWLVKHNNIWLRKCQTNGVASKSNEQSAKTFYNLEQLPDRVIVIEPNSEPKSNKHT